MAGAMVLGAAGAVLASSGTDAPRERSITVFARQYAFDPPVIRANRGDTLRLTLVSLDVVHGFYLEGHDLDAEIRPQEKKVRLRRPSRGGAVEEVGEVVVVLDRPGKFRYRCSHTCGALHPFMNGELLVAPNRLLQAGVGASVGLLLGFALLAFWRVRRPGEAT